MKQILYLIKSIDNTFFFSGSYIEDDSEFGGEQPDSSKKPWPTDQKCNLINIIQVNYYNPMRLNIFCVFIN